MLSRRNVLSLFVVFAFATTTTFAVPESSMETAASSVSYDMEFFSFDGPLRGAAASHSFVRLRKIVAGLLTEVVDISWLPEPGSFRRNGRVPLLRQVGGHNYSLEETFAIAGGRPVFSHGRFDAAPELFEAAKRRRNELESGVIDYKMLDQRRFPSASNCIHAISGILAYLPTGLRRGASASNSLVSFFLGTGLLWPMGSRPPLFAAAPPAPSVPQAPAPAPAAAEEPPPAFQPPTHEAPSSPPPAFVQAPVARRRPILNALRRR